MITQGQEIILKKFKIRKPYIILIMETTNRITNSRMSPKRMKRADLLKLAEYTTLQIGSLLSAILGSEYE